MTFVSIISFQKHICPKPAADLLTQDWNVARGYCMLGCDERDSVSKNSEISDNSYMTNLPVC